MNIFGLKYSDKIISANQSTKSIKKDASLLISELFYNLDLIKDEGFADYIIEFLEIEYYDKNEIIYYSHSPVGNNICMILDGAIEYYYEIFNKEESILLINNGNFCININDVYNVINSECSIRTVRNTMILKINSFSLNTLFNSKYSKSIHRFIDIIKKKQEKFLFDFFVINKTSAIHRTEKVLSDFSEVFKNIPQHRVSHFLGINSETFSRIKMKNYTSSNIS